MATCSFGPCLWPALWFASQSADWESEFLNMKYWVGLLISVKKMVVIHKTGNYVSQKQIGKFLMIAL
jgi:hypothetical protein